MLTCEEYLDAVLKYYQSTFDIERPYMLESEECLAYGHFYSHSEKYVLTRSAKMWEANSFEHAFFFQCPVPGAEMVERVRELAERHVEPQMVRGGNALPEKNHMYTYLTFVFLSEGAVTPETVKAVKKFKLTRNYLFPSGAGVRPGRFWWISRRSACMPMQRENRWSPCLRKF